MAQSRPKTTTNPLKAIARTITDHGRRIRDLELRPDPASSGGDTFLRLTWCGGGSSEADFDGSGSTFEKFLTFEGPLALEQSGGFVFSDHPDAASIDWDTVTVVAANHHLHRIEVPEHGIYTVTLNYFFDVTFGPNVFGSGDVDYIDVETKIEPDTIRATSWFYPQLLAGNISSQQGISECFTVELDSGTPFWITAHPTGRLADGSSAPGELLQTRTRDASLTVEKST